MKNPDYEKWKQENPDAAAAFANLYEQIVGVGQSTLDEKTKQLLYITALTAVGYAPAVKTHIVRAYQAGATKDEARAAIMIPILSSGVCAVLRVYSEVSELL